MAGSSSESSSSCSRRVCECGTTVLFPPGLETRTCWNCGVIHARSSQQKSGDAGAAPHTNIPAGADKYRQREAQQGPAPSPQALASPQRPPAIDETARVLELLQPYLGSEPPPQRAAPHADVRSGALHQAPPPSSAVTATFGSGAASSSSSSPLAGQAAAARSHNAHATTPEPPNITALGSAQSAASAGDRQSSASQLSHVVWLVLAISLAMNGVLLAGRHDQVASCKQHPTIDISNGNSQPSSTIRSLAQPGDEDGDGVPDHHDFCPSKHCAPGDILCSPSGWVSGRATDFDQDGCADGTEDTDKDNDGIIDSQDKCPLTPQKYTFVSNHISDFDGDGCADGLEDTDDDGDAVPNAMDSCPRTAAWDVSDNSGCSNFQNERPETMELHRLHASITSSNAGQAPKAKAETEEKPTRLQEWLNTLHGAGVEVIVGAILTAALGKAHHAYTQLHQKLPRSPTDSVRRLSTGVAAGLSSVRSGHARPANVDGRPQNILKGLWSWRPSGNSVQLHAVRIAGYCLVVYMSRYHSNQFTIASLRSALSSGMLQMSTSLESFAASLSADSE